MVERKDGNVKLSDLGLNDRPFPKNPYCPTMAEVRALYSISQSETISPEISAALGLDNDHLQPIIKNWNSAVEHGIGESLKDTTISLFSNGVCLSANIKSANETVLKKSTLASTLMIFYIEQHI